MSHDQYVGLVSLRGPAKVLRGTFAEALVSAVVLWCKRQHQVAPAGREIIAEALEPGGHFLQVLLIVQQLLNQVGAQPLLGFSAGHLL